jgi:NAD(P)H-dependent flavin oxidoreductase YrpB (nitropropane dioxygenase family)
MNYKPLQIGDLIAERPIVQGGMGVGISLGNLAGAVAKEGGVGIISSAQIGFKEEDFENNPRLANKKAIKKEYEKARRISPNGIIGFYDCPESRPDNDPYRQINHVPFNRKFFKLF